jgi:O-antigen ligase
MKAAVIRVTKTQFYKYAVWIIAATIVVMITGIVIAEGKWIYSVALLVTVGAFFISIKRPFIFPFGVYALLLPFDSLLSLTGNEGSTFTKSLGILTAIVFFVKGSFEKTLKRPDKVTIWLTIFFAYAFLSIIWATFPGITIGAVSSTAGLLILYLVVTCYPVTKNEFDTVKWLILVGGLLAAMVTIYQFTNGIVYSNFGGRGTLLFGDRLVGPNKLAFDMLFPLSIAIGMAMEKKQIIIKIVLSLILGAIVFGIFLTGSRGGLAASATILIVYMFFSKKRITLGIVFVIVAVVVIPMIPEFFFQRIGDSVSSHAEGRGDIWVVGLHVLDKYWLLGAGQDNFEKVYTEFASYAPIFEGVDRSAHNLYLRAFVELGIVGFSLLIISLAKHYQILRLRINRYDCDDNQTMLKAVFWGMLVSSLSQDTFFYKSFWLLLIMILLHKKVLLSEQ